MMKWIWVVSVLLLPSVALANPTWLVLSPRASGMEEGDKDAFQDLLGAEIRTLSKEAVSLSPEVCADERCACDTGTGQGAYRVVYSNISRLGQKWIVTATAVNMEGCSPINSARLSVLRIEDLEEVANKMARVMVDGKSLEEATEVGNVTEKEQEPARLREGNDGLSLRVGGAVPIQSFKENFGVMFEAGYWFEALDFAIEPTLGFQVSAASKDGATYGMFKLGASGVYLFSRGNVAPFLGAGGGIRYVEDERPRDFEFGSTLQLVGGGTSVESAWAPGAVIRGGVLFLRTYETRLALTLDYDMTFVELHDTSITQTMNIGINVIF